MTRMNEGDNEKDMHLVCIDCGDSFLFTVGEQQYYRSKSLTIPPKRCPQCRAERKKRIVPDKGVQSG